MTKRDKIEKISNLFKALSDPNRLTIMFAIKEEEKNVTELMDYVDLEQSALSHQLRVLKDNHLVKSERRGKKVYYSPDDEHVYQLLAQAQDHVEHG